MAENGLKRLEAPIKSPEDRKVYRCIKLKNGLEAILISDCFYQHIAMERKSSCAKKNEENEDEIETRIAKFNKEIIRDPEICRLRKKNPSLISTLASLIVSSKDEKCPNPSNSGSINEHVARARVNKNACKSFNMNIKAHISVSVGVGSYFDPVDPEILGLAHFCEHMVFMGSKKFPTENYIDKYVESNGGTAPNAYTSTTSTEFYYSIPVSSFEKSLEILVDMLQNPLIKEESMEREIKAVESEWCDKKTLESISRFYLLKLTAKEGHPSSRFTLGNQESLNSKRQFLLQELKKFHKRYYKANYIKIVLRAPLQLDELERIVVNYFSSFEYSEEPKPSIIDLPLPFDTCDFKRIYKVYSLSNSCFFQIMWELPASTWMDYKSSPIHYITWMLSHQNKNSLTAYLQKKNLVVEQESCSLYYNTEASCLLNICYKMSDNGLDNYNDILRAIFSYINFLKKSGSSEDIFFDIQDTDLISFHFKSHFKDSLKSVLEISRSMHHYSSEDILITQYLVTQFEEERIKEALELMSPRRANVMIYSCKFENIVNKTEYYTNAKYSTFDFEAVFLTELESIKPYSDFSLPNKNPYVFDRFKKLLPENKQDLQIYPFNLKIDNSSVILWYRMSIRDRMTMYHLLLGNEVLVRTPKGKMYLDLWISSLNDTANSTIWLANKVNYTIEIQGNGKGIEICLRGTNAKLIELLSNFLDILKDFENLLTQERYKTLYSNQKNVYAQKVSNGEKYLKDLTNEMLVYGHISYFEKMKELNTACFGEFLNFTKKFKENMTATLLIQGNEVRSKAIEVAQMIQNTFNLRHSLLCPTNNMFCAHRERIIPLNESFLQVKAVNPEDENVFVCNVYQIGTISLKSYFILAYIQNVIKDKIFKELRTTQQLGYDVNFRYQEKYGVLNAYIKIYGSSGFTAEEICTRIDKFLESFYPILAKHAKEHEIEKFIRCALAEEVEKVGIGNWENMLWTELKYSGSIFVNRSNFLKSLDRITRKDILDFYANYFLKKKGSELKGYRKMSFQVAGKNSGNKNHSKSKKCKTSLQILNHEISLPEDQTIRSKYLTNFNNFKQNLPLYPRNSYRFTHFNK